MPKRLMSALILIFGSILLDAQPATEHLQNVKAIFVAPLDGRNPEIGNLISAKLISHLAKLHAVSIVESEDKADAILTGSGQIQTVSNVYGHTGYKVQAAMRLVSKDGVILWADDISNSPFARSATSSFADNVAKKLAEAILGEDKKKFQ